MLTLNLVFDLVQLAVVIALSIANGVIAYSVFKIQKDRNTGKPIVYMDLVEEDDRIHCQWGNSIFSVQDTEGSQHRENLSCT